MRKFYRPNNSLLKIILRENLYLLLAGIFFVPIIYYIKEEKPLVLDFLFIKIILVLLFIYNVPALIIFLNYYRENRNTKLEIDTPNDIIKIISNGIPKQYKLSEVKSSIYHLGIYYKNRIDNARRRRMPNSDFAYWDLEFKNGDRYFISNLLVDFLHQEPIVENTKFRYRMFQHIDKSDPKEGISLKKAQEKNRVEHYIEKFQSKDINQLNQILNNKKNYRKEAVIAAEIVSKTKKSNQH